MSHKYIAIITLVLLIVALSLKTYKESHLAPIIAVSSVLSSQSDSTESTTIQLDYSKLDSFIKDKEIIVLGENIHYGGTTFAFKTQMVKYLYEKHGYKTLFFEANLYDISRIHHDVTRRKEAFWLFWSNTKEMDPLWDFIHTKKEIQLAGFDIQMSGYIDGETRAHDIDSILASNHIAMPPAIDSLKLRIRGLEYLKKSFSASKRTHILKSLRNISSQLNDKNEFISARYFQNIAEWLEIVWKYSSKNCQRLNDRDSLMAENIFFLKEHYFKDQKIIIWAANLHALETSDKDGFTSMNYHLKKKYKDKVFTICSTYYAHSKDAHTLYDYSSNQTLEYQLYKKGYKYALIDLSKIKSKAFRSRINQGIESTYNWGKMTDALFFMTAETPITYK